MEINALVISGPDPGAIPGGSTITLPPPLTAGTTMGPISIDGRVKGLLSSGMSLRDRLIF